MKSFETYVCVNWFYYLDERNTIAKCGDTFRNILCTSIHSLINIVTLHNQYTILNEQNVQYSLRNSKISDIIIINDKQIQ